MKDSKDIIRKDLDTAINDIYYKYQKKNGITDGFIHPCDSFMQDMIVDNLASVIAKVIMEEKALMKCSRGR